MSWIKNIFYILSTIFFIALFSAIIVAIIFFAVPAKFDSVDPILRITNIDINYRDDINKPGIMHSRLFDAGFSMKKKGKGSSPDVVHIRFDHPAEVLGFLVSLDLPDFSLNLVEMALVKNQEKGYATGTHGDAILHTSYVLNSYRSQDEKIMFQPGYGVHMKNSDYLALGAYITNLNPFRSAAFSGEFIIFYRWLNVDEYGEDYNIFYWYDKVEKMLQKSKYDKRLDEALEKIKEKSNYNKGR